MNQIKNNEFLKNQFPLKMKKMKSLEQKLAESKTKLENLSNIKPTINNKFVSICSS